MLIEIDKEDIIKNSSSSSKSTILVAFKVFNKKTPESLTRKLLKIWVPKCYSGTTNKEL
jgi:hypothetical protein